MIAFAILLVLGILGLALTLPCATVGCDAHAYWSAWQGGQLYSRLVLEPDAYLYPPPLAQVIYPLTVLPWGIFRAAVAIGAGVSYWWLLRPLPRPLILACLPAVLMGVGVGNIEWLLALVCVMGFSRPQVWAVALATKVTPGIGLLWHVALAEWRGVAAGLFATALVVAVSFALDASAWREWITFAQGSAGALTHYSWTLNAWLPLPVRILGAAALIVVGARQGRRWTLPVAVLLAQPDLNPPSFLILSALPRTTRVTRGLLSRAHGPGDREAVRREVRAAAGPAADSRGDSRGDVDTPPAAARLPWRGGWHHQTMRREQTPPR